MAISSYDAQNLTAAQQASLASYTADWNAAKAAGDTQAMAAAHSAAEAVRNSAGYTSDSYGNFAGYTSAGTPSYDFLVNQAKVQTEYNNAIAQENAQSQWDFNASEAQKSRDWTEYMSNTAHQREVKDLIAAGLNPVLSSGGSGAPVTSGVSASGSSATNDTSTNSVFGSYLNALIQSATSLVSSQNSANAVLGAAYANASASKYMADMSFKANSEYPTMSKFFGSLLGQFLSGSNPSEAPSSGSSSSGKGSSNNYDSLIQKVGDGFVNGFLFGPEKFADFLDWAINDALKKK